MAALGGASRGSLRVIGGAGRSGRRRGWGCGPLSTRATGTSAAPPPPSSTPSSPRPLAPSAVRVACCETRTKALSTPSSPIPPPAASLRKRAASGRGAAWHPRAAPRPHAGVAAPARPGPAPPHPTGMREWLRLSRPGSLQPGVSRGSHPRTGDVVAGEVRAET